MTENSINTFLPNIKSWKGIKITTNARKQILFLINLNSDVKGIRLSIKKSGCAGFRYSMKLVHKREEKNTEEIIFLYKDIFVYISHEDSVFLEEVTIDFIKDNINKVFKFYNSKVDKFCGCGESFLVN